MKNINNIIVASCEGNTRWKQTSTECTPAPIDRVRGVLLESPHWSHHLHSPRLLQLFLRSLTSESNGGFNYVALSTTFMDNLIKGYFAVEAAVDIRTESTKWQV